jgi:hypothetical protein
MMSSTGESFTHPEIPSIFDSLEVELLAYLSLMYELMFEQGFSYRKALCRVSKLSGFHKRTLIVEYRNFTEKKLYDFLNLT